MGAGVRDRVGPEEALVEGEAGEGVGGCVARLGAVLIVPVAL